MISQSRIYELSLFSNKNVIITYHTNDGIVLIITDKMKLCGKFNICTIKVEIKAYSLFQDIYEEHLGDFLFF